VKRLLALLGLLLALVVPASAVAQTGSTIRLFFGELEGTQDTVYATPAGSDVSLTVHAHDQNSAIAAIGAFTFRIYFDPARVSFVTARSSCPDSATNPLNPPVTGANYVELSANGCASAQLFIHKVATVTLRLAAGATTGSALYLEPVAVNDRNATNRTADAVGDVDELCLGVGIWGDVDDDALVNSRDALIALSNAVGLPTPGFLVSRGDVDGDSYVGSRDALGMLSASIGYPPAFGFRTGRAIVTACAPQPVFPRALYFMRQGAYPGVAGVSGLVVRAAGDSAQTIVGDSADAVPFVDNRPRVSPNGSQVVFVCYWDMPGFGRYFNICRADASGSGLVNLSGGGFSTDQSPDWSPASDSIVFVRDNQIWVMAADGSNQHVVPASPSVYSVAWDPTAGSRRVVYTAATFPGAVRTRDIDNLTPDSLLFTGPPNATDLRSADWSPAGDSIVFAANVDSRWNGVFVTARAGGGATRVARVYGSYAPDPKPAWTNQGILFSMSQDYPSPSRHRLFVLRPNGLVERIGRDPTGNFGPGMDKQ